jgi:hypothetical protein
LLLAGRPEILVFDGSKFFELIVQLLITYDCLDNPFGEKSIETIELHDDCIMQAGGIKTIGVELFSYEVVKSNFRVINFYKCFPELLTANVSGF